eukprot:gb/GFBE01019870.1/.p1 GENE.gb/GFBE01019870.1/~~gb/GFBE01019870.1/.p1  ORF type:complete len:304 (+),score=61.53 gb/GFBE01019870.1/:1-912(+)
MEALATSKELPWNAREKPATYNPVQTKPGENQFPMPYSFVDWWSPRSMLLCCCYPAFWCINGRGNPCAGGNSVDITDPSIWKEALAQPTACPDSMKGVWWLKDNLAHECLICLHDAEWSGDFNSAGTRGIARMRKRMDTLWSREQSAFGKVLQAAATLRSGEEAWVGGLFNFDIGKGQQLDAPVPEWGFKISEDEYWKAFYYANPGEPRGDDIYYMYKWIRVMRPDGSTTAAFEDFKSRCTMPDPNANCGTSWCSCWPAGLSMEQRLQSMNVLCSRQSMFMRPERFTQGQGSSEKTPLQQAMG